MPVGKGRQVEGRREKRKEDSVCVCAELAEAGGSKPDELHEKEHVPRGMCA